MNAPCTIETGLFKKKPCGHASVTKCANCEQPLCKEHAVAQKKPGVFMCKDCDAAAKQFEKTQADVAKQQKEKQQAEIMKSIANPAPPKPKGAPAGPAAPAAGAAAKPAASQPAKGATPPPPPPADDAPLEFTPSEKPKK
jgi:hypothetical protein